MPESKHDRGTDSVPALVVAWSPVISVGVDSTGIERSGRSVPDPIAACRPASVGGPATAVTFSLT
jgi:hypothetical protein